MLLTGPKQHMNFTLCEHEEFCFIHWLFTLSSVLLYHSQMPENLILKCYPCVFSPHIVTLTSLLMPVNY